MNQKRGSLEIVHFNKKNNAPKDCKRPNMSMSHGNSASSDSPAETSIPAAERTANLTLSRWKKIFPSCKAWLSRRSRQSWHVIIAWRCARSRCFREGPGELFCAFIYYGHEGLNWGNLGSKKYSQSGWVVLAIAVGFRWSKAFHARTMEDQWRINSLFAAPWIFPYGQVERKRTRCTIP